MDARSELFVYMGAALTTIAVLFGAQSWYASYLDVSVVHAPNHDAPSDAKVAAVRAAEQQKLEAGAVPIVQAQHAIAERGRGASAKLAPQASEDLSAMSGWIHRPGFAPYEPRKAPAAMQVVTTAVDVAAADPTAAPAEAPAPVVPTKKVVLPARPAAAARKAAQPAAPAALPQPAAPAAPGAQ